MLAKVESYGLMGLEGFTVEVEVDVTNSLPSFEIVGLPDAAVRESRERVRSAIRNSGFAYPPGKVTVNLAPADMRKEGSVYDLPIAMGLLAATGQAPYEDSWKGWVFLGELALNGEVRGINGLLPMVMGAMGKGACRFVVPAGNVAEISCLEGMAAYGVETLRDAAMIMSGGDAAPIERRVWDAGRLTYSSDFADIKGQYAAKRAAEIAAAGGHNMLLLGTPGSGKTMLARSIPSILPEMTFEEAVEITKIHSVAGLIRGESGLVSERPYRSPHHSASTAALVGGGTKALPGEISLAHYGVLFLDEFPEFKKDVLEALRQPLEDGAVTITRANVKSTYPANFMLIAAMNPCPCGYYGSRVRECRCRASEVARYRGRISGPMLDRIDMHVEMAEVGYTELTSNAPSESSAAIRARVNRARHLQRERYKGEGVICNAQLNSRLSKKYCRADDEAEKLLRTAFDRLNLSARAYNRIMKVARTIADLAGSAAITPEHMAEAIQYRAMDKKYWGE